jgi:hypothetical protein
VHLVDGDEGQRREHELASAIDPPRQPRFGKIRSDATPSTMVFATRCAVSGLVSAM